MAEIPCRIVIAPDSLKGTATAAQVAEAIGAGWREVRPADAVRSLTMADGGEGTVAAFEAAVPGALRQPVTVTGPDDRTVDTYWLQLPDGSGVVELASTSGITLLHPLRPMTAHSRGFGQAISAALDAGVSRLLLAIGGSSSTDGGTGVLKELGAPLLDRHGDPIADGGAGLLDLATADLSALRPLPPGGVFVLSDVTAPLNGPSGAAHVFGAQKGATGEQISVLDAALNRWGGFGTGADMPGAGAAGGVGYGLLMWGATIAAGFAAVAEALGLPVLIQECDLVITGEGRFDSQSLTGKVPSHILESAGRAGVPVALVAGAIDGPIDSFAVTASLTTLAGSTQAAITAPVPALQQAGRALARWFSAGREQNSLRIVDR